MLVLSTTDFVLSNGSKYSWSLVCAVFQQNLLVHPLSNNNLSLIDASFSENITQLSSENIESFRNWYEDVKAVPIDETEKLNTLTSVVVSYIETNPAEPIIILDGPQSETECALRNYFSQIQSLFSLKAKSSSQLSSIQFILSNEFSRFSSKFSSYSSSFSMQTSDSRITQMMENGVMGLHEFMSGAVHSQLVENLKCSHYTRRSSQLTVPLQTQTSFKRRKRSLSPAAFSQSQQGQRDSELGGVGGSELSEYMYTDEDTSEVDYIVNSHSSSSLGGRHHQDAPRPSPNSKKRKSSTQRPRGASRAAKLLALSLQPQAQTSTDVVNTKLTTTRLKRSASPVAVFAEDSMHLASKVTNSTAHSELYTTDKNESHQSNVHKMASSFFKASLNKLYSRDETCELIDFTSGREVVKHIENEVSLLPNELSLIGLRQLQQALFQMNGFHFKFHQSTSSQTHEHNTDFCFNLFFEVISLPSLQIDENFNNAEKRFVVLFEAFRFICSSTLNETNPDLENLRKLSSQLLISIPSEKEHRFHNFLKLTFFQWYLHRKCRPLAISFLEEISKHSMFESTLGQYLSKNEDWNSDENKCCSCESSDQSEPEETSSQNDFIVDISHTNDSFNNSSQSSQNASMTKQPVRFKKRFATQGTLKYLIDESLSKIKSSNKNDSLLTKKNDPLSIDEKNSRKEKLNLKITKGDYKMVAKLDKSVLSGNKQSNKLQSRMLQRSLSQNVKSQSSITSGSKNETVKPPNQPIKGQSDRTDVKTLKRFDHSSEKKKRPVSSKRKRSVSISKTPSGKENSKNKRKGKKLLTKKVLETPGDKLLKRGKFAIASSNKDGCLSSDLTELANFDFSLKVGETPLSKMPKDNSGPDVKKKVVSDKNEANHRKCNRMFARKESFYKSHKTDVSNAEIKRRTHRPLTNVPEENLNSRRDKVMQQTPSKEMASRLTEWCNDENKYSPFSILFKPDHGKGDHRKYTAILTPAKVNVSFSDEDFSKLDSPNSIQGETPLRGIFSILKSSGKKMQAFHNSNTLTVVDNIDRNGSEQKSIPESSGHEHLTRSTTKITQLHNVKVSATKKDVTNSLLPDSNRSKIRKSLFGKNSKSPTKFSARSSFHDENSNPAIYKIFCDDADSMDMLSDLTNDSKPTTLLDSSCIPSKGNTEASTLQSTSSAATNPNYNDNFSFTIRKKLPLSRTASNSSSPSCSPSPINYKCQPILRSQLSEMNSSGLMGSQCSRRNDLAIGAGYSERYASDNLSYNDNNGLTNGRMQRALDDLLRNPFTQMSPMLRSATASPA